jgi:hypothetical protein
MRSTSSMPMSPWSPASPDHMAWLGDTPGPDRLREGRHLPAGRPAVIGQRMHRRGCASGRLEIGAEPLQQGREFHAQWMPANGSGAAPNALQPRRAAAAGAARAGAVRQRLRCPRGRSPGYSMSPTMRRRRGRWRPTSPPILVPGTAMPCSRCWRTRMPCRVRGTGGAGASLAHRAGAEGSGPCRWTLHAASLAAAPDRPVARYADVEQAIAGAAERGRAG